MIAIAILLNRAFSTLQARSRAILIMRSLAKLRKHVERTVCTMAETPKVAEVYSVPLTKSAAKEAPESAHSMFVDALSSHLENMFAEGGSLSGYGSYTEMSGFLAKETKKLSTLAKYPDLTYASDHVVVLGEAKSNAPDLNNPHTDSQIVAYVNEMNEEYPSHKKVLMLSAPYGIHGLLRQKLAKIDRMQGGRFFEGIDIELVSELTDKEVKEPEGWSQMVDEAVKSTDVVILDGKVERVDDMFIPVENLVLDGRNSRLLGFDPNQMLSQEECYEKLLADGDSKDRNDAVYRRIRMAEEGCIHTPIIVLDMGDGTYLVYDGNSRVSFARDIRSQAASAKGYRFIRAKVFPVGTSRETLEAYKQKVQSDVILKHGMIQDAADIYRKHAMGMSDEEIADTFGKKYSVGIIRGSYRAIQWLIDLGVRDDERIAKFYMAAFKIIDVTPNRKSALANKGIMLDDIMKRFIEFGCDEAWMDKANLDMMVTVINNCRQPWKMEALKGFVDKDPQWATVAAWKESMTKLEARNNKQGGIEVAIKQATQANSQMSDFIEYINGVIDSLNESESVDMDKEILGDLSRTKGDNLTQLLDEMVSRAKIAAGKIQEAQMIHREHARA